MQGNKNCCLNAIISAYFGNLDETRHCLCFYTNILLFSVHWHEICVRLNKTGLRDVTKINIQQSKFWGLVLNPEGRFK